MWVLSQFFPLSLHSESTPLRSWNVISSSPLLQGCGTPPAAPSPMSPDPPQFRPSSPALWPFDDSVGEHAMGSTCGIVSHVSLLSVLSRILTLTPPSSSFAPAASRLRNCRAPHAHVPPFAHFQQHPFSTAEFNINLPLCSKHPTPSSALSAPTSFVTATTVDSNDSSHGHLQHRPQLIRNQHIKKLGRVRQWELVFEAFAGVSLQLRSCFFVAFCYPAAAAALRPPTSVTSADHPLPPFSNNTVAGTKSVPGHRRPHPALTKHERNPSVTLQRPTTPSAKHDEGHNPVIVAISGRKYPTYCNLRPPPRRNTRCVVDDHHDSANHHPSAIAETTDNDGASMKKLALLWCITEAARVPAQPWHGSAKTTRQDNGDSAASSPRGNEPTNRAASHN
ncbi:hypothetical protein GALMADRAFT_144250 [Galerina marginata CBS 339.88]|uniref:Uncharacterized protein n=1 Tax=Galerina marginata (strain CBS 339.88) TaxID=685588 RepID=A0A067SU07_GALM3|nr:hypothetical protein GALMADRAFT_144250 [Galerina marginata CBS 339.88]